MYLIGDTTYYKTTQGGCLVEAVVQWTMLASVHCRIQDWPLPQQPGAGEGLYPIGSSEGDSLPTDEAEHHTSWYSKNIYKAQIHFYRASKNFEFGGENR